MTDIQYAILISFFIGFLAGSVYEWKKAKKDIDNYRELGIKYRNKYKELKLKLKGKDNG